ncbi:L7Ae/L30e/S12e/Gadd45 family ribosomal protein [Candidatus Palauibacter sp.]|uniref:L7Ae/L30e/S12e/Gadd45 family ribosomal protein n=1 Tax=Candidatus Palauibacter sp. TaxID=3101350 RepID=UPI003B028BA1
MTLANGRLGLLGIAMRAGRVALGTRAVDGAARRGRLALLVVASDASRHALGRLPPEARAASRVTVASREALGRALGRNDVAVAGVTDVALAARILEAECAPAGGDHSSGSAGDPEGRVP